MTRTIKEGKYLSATEVADLMGKKSWNLKDFYAKLTNYSPSQKFRLYEESEVLAKKGNYLAEAEEKRQRLIIQRQAHCDRIREKARIEGTLGSGKRGPRGFYNKTLKTANVNNDDLKERLRLLKEIAELEKKI